MPIINGRPKPKVVLILGAGFSCEAALPTTPQLSGQFLKSPRGSALPPVVETEITKHLKQFWNRVFGYQSGAILPSLEDHFTNIDLAANTGHQIGPWYSPKKLRAIRRLAIHRAFQILDLKFKESPTIRRLLGQLSDTTELQIVSVNWDIVVEKHLQALKLNYDYGSIVKSLHGNETLHDSGIHLYKLHGSANWVYCDSCRTLFSSPPQAGKGALHMGAFLDPEDFGALGSTEPVVDSVRSLDDTGMLCRLCGCRMSARVGTFSYRKDFAIQQFQTIWHSAFSALRESDAWLFIGYSMPEADFEFRQVLKSAELACRTGPTKSISVVVKNDPQATDRFRRFFGLELSNIHDRGLSGWMRKDFSVWLKKTLTP